jgi:hypothetical protein
VFIFESEPRIIFALGENLYLKYTCLVLEIEVKMFAYEPQASFRVENSNMSGNDNEVTSPLTIGPGKTVLRPEDLIRTQQRRASFRLTKTAKGSQAESRTLQVLTGVRTVCTCQVD